MKFQDNCPHRPFREGVHLAEEFRLLKVEGFPEGSSSSDLLFLDILYTNHFFFLENLHFRCSKT